MCWPFGSDGQTDKCDELPDLHVPKFRWWNCIHCQEELADDNDATNDRENCCSHSRLKPSATCSHVSSPAHTAILQSDLQQPKVVKLREGGADATMVIDLNDDGCIPSSPSSPAGKDDKKFESAQKPVSGKIIANLYIFFIQHNLFSNIC